MAKSKNDSLEKIKELKKAYKDEKVDDSKDEIKELSGDAKIAQEILNRYKTLKEDLASKDITIEKLDKSLDNMQSLVIYAFEQSERELTDKKSKVGKFFNLIGKAGKSVGALLGMYGTYSASNIKKVFDEVRAEKIVNFIKDLVKKTPLSKFGTRGYMLDANYYVGGTVSISTYLEKRFTNYLYEKLKRFQRFFENYSQICVKYMGKNNAKTFKDTYPITSALIRVTSGLAGIAVEDKKSDTNILYRLGNWSENDRLYYVPKGYMAAFIYDVYNIIAMAMHTSSDKNFQNHLKMSHQELFNKYKKRRRKKTLPESVESELAPSKALTHKDMEYPEFELLEEEADEKEEKAKDKDKNAEKNQNQATKYQEYANQQKAEAEKLRQEAQALRQKAQELRQKANT